MSFAAPAKTSPSVVHVRKRTTPVAFGTPHREPSVMVHDASGFTNFLSILTMSDDERKRVVKIPEKKNFGQDAKAHNELEVFSRLPKIKRDKIDNLLSFYDRVGNGIIENFELSLILKKFGIVTNYHFV
jgi:hypothetical protein